MEGTRLGRYVPSLKIFQRARAGIAVSHASVLAASGDTKQREF
jgi:hypothetical protein